MYLQEWKISSLTICTLVPPILPMLETPLKLTFFKSPTTVPNRFHVNSFTSQFSEVQGMKKVIQDYI
jgi:hypothetical protein